MTECSRREFLKYAGAAGTALAALDAKQLQAAGRSPVTLVNTDDRKEGVTASVKALRINPAQNKDVLIKPNFNTADVTPGSTHNDTLVALVEELWGMGAKSISLGERSYPPTHQVMEQKGILPLMKDLNVKIIDFDTMPKKDWIHIKGEGSH